MENCSPRTSDERSLASVARQMGGHLPRSFIHYTGLGVRGLFPVSLGWAFLGVKGLRWLDTFLELYVELAREMDIETVRPTLVKAWDGCMIHGLRIIVGSPFDPDVL